MEETAIDQTASGGSAGIKRAPQQGLWAFAVAIGYLTALLEIGDDSFYLIYHHAALAATWLSLLLMLVSIVLYFRGWWRKGTTTTKDGSKVDASFTYFSGAVMLILVALVEYQHTVVAACRLRHNLAP